MEQPKCLNSPEISLLVRIKRGQTNSVTEGVPGYKKKYFLNVSNTILGLY